MRDAIQRHLVAIVLAVGVLVGLGRAPAQAAAAPVQSATVQTVQYYGPGPGYYRGPPPGYYGRRFYGPGYGPRPGFYGRGPGFYRRGFYGRPYGRRFYR